MTHLVWFRNDLRCSDNTALARADLHSNKTIALIYATPNQWQLHGRAAKQVGFWLVHVDALQHSLLKIGVPLYYVEVPFFKNIPEHLARFVTEHQIKSVFFNKEYGWNERIRDAEVTQILTKNGIKVSAFDDDVLIAPAHIKTAAGFYKVFTPFKQACIKYLMQTGLTLAQAPYQKQTCAMPPAIPKHMTGFLDLTFPPQWQVGEPIAHNLLKNFIDLHAKDYQIKRDFPAENQTSLLSPYLALGVISIRACMQAALMANQYAFDSGSSGLTTWISELLWREFYRHVMWHFPRVSKAMPFKLETQKIIWHASDDLWSRWCEARTGVPIIDAAMRQLLETSWMHNRLRMISAMYLTKDYFIDWRRGEHFFMQHLIDGDFASNNGGWQWCASTGTDAVPYFRIFNPTQQSLRFDPDAKFIKKFLPELKGLDAKTIHQLGEYHNPKRLLIRYPQPAVDHKMARQNAIDVFKKL